MPERPSRGACAIADLASFTGIRDLIEARCGLRFDDSQRASLCASVTARMQQLGLVSEIDYVDRLRGPASGVVETELRNLLNLVTVTETCFFRDASQFRLFREIIVPDLLSDRSRAERPRTIRIWSAGCSSGEEAYSIAMALHDMGLYSARQDWAIEIVGTDLNSEALAKARLGVYSARAVRNVERRQLDAYFERDGKSYALKETIRNRVKFEFGNLTHAPMPTTGMQDVVFCKNVAIYFRGDATRRLIDGLRNTLAPGGYLLLGHAESLWQMSEGFTLVEHERAFAYRKAAAQRPNPVAAEAVPRAVAAPAAQERIDPSAEYDFCLAAFRTGEWDAAESALTALVRACPTFVPGLLLLGGLHAHRGRFDDAMAQAESVLTVSDLEPRAHLLLGMVAARRCRPDEALRSLRRALYLDDSLALGHFWLGNLYRERGEVARACQEYENIVRDWERHTLQLTEEFASDLTAEQLVGFCRDTLERLQALSGDR